MRKIHLLILALLGILVSLFVLIFMSFLQTLENETSHFETDRIVWSPDRSHIALAIWSRYFSRKILILNLQNHHYIEIPVTEAYYPVWSPDGSKIAFTRLENDNISDIYVADFDGNQLSNIVQLTNNDAYNQFPSWSPDSTRLAFSTLYNRRRQLHTVDIATRVLENFTSDAYIGPPAWSPDGLRIAYFAGGNDQYDIHVLTLSTNESMNLTNRPATYNRLTWSPDGERLAFTQENSVEDIHAGLYVIDVETANLTLLANSPNYASLDWSPDSSKISFHDVFKNPAGLFIVNVNGSNAALCRISDARYFAWDRTGQALLTMTPPQSYKDLDSLSPSQINLSPCA